MESLKSYFNKYKNLMSHLSSLVRVWAINYSILDGQIFRESVLEEKISDQEKEELEEKIADLEFQIKNCENEIINIINIIKRTLERRLYYSINVINTINKDHIEAMIYYDSIVKDYERTIEKFGKNNVNISFVDLEQSKKQLNNSIKDFNEKMILAHNTSARLIDVNEALSTAEKQEYERLKAKIEQK